MIKRYATALPALVLCWACASPPIQLTPEAAKVQVGRSDPSDNYELLGAVTAQDGSGCGLYGRRGSYDQALTILRVRAALMHANYVAITTITEPHLAAPNCFANAFVINGMAYRKVAEAPSPIQIQNVPDSSNNDDLVEKLKQLNELHAAGALTDDEFERAKALLLQ